MKILISADMEGITGIVNGWQVNRDKADYSWARKMMVEDVNAAIEGALKAGATEIIVNDSHDTMSNIFLDELHPEAYLISGGSKEFSMMQGIGSDIDAVFFVGYHNLKGTKKAIMDHTYSGRLIQEVKINGKVMGETGLNALVAGHFDVPVALVTGDLALSKEVKELLGEEVETVVVKEAAGRFSAKCIPADKARKAITQGAENALKKLKSIKPLKFNPPYHLEVTFPSTSMVDYAILMPGVKRENGFSISLSMDNYLELFKAFRALIILASSGT